MTRLLLIVFPLAILYGCLPENSITKSSPILNAFTDANIPSAENPSEPYRVLNSNYDQTWNYSINAIEEMHGVIINNNKELGFITFYSDLAPLLKKCDLMKPEKLAEKLRNADDPFDLSIQQNLSIETRNALNTYDNNKEISQKLIDLILKDLNNIIYGNYIYEDGRFKNAKQKKKKIIEIKFLEEDKIRLHRMILENAYPQEIAKNYFLDSRKSLTTMYCTLKIQKGKLDDQTVIILESWINANPSGLENKLFFDLVSNQLTKL